MSANVHVVLGGIVATPASLALLASAGVLPSVLLDRHQRGDWGDLCAEDARQNDEALTCGDRLLSSYPVAGQKVWVITEADRSATTLLLPEEY